MKFSLLLFLMTATAVWSQVDPPPGSYDGPLTLNVLAPEGAAVRYRFLETPSLTTFPWNAPLRLEALPGEKRAYGLRITTDLPSGETTTRDYRYLVSGRKGALATVQPEPGRYTAAVTVKAVLPAGWKVVENGKPAAFPRLLDVAPGGTSTVLFEASGPLGERFDWKYTVDRRDQETTDLQIVSPLAGSWANTQSLVAVFRGVDQVRWSYGDHLDAHAQDYTGPVRLDRPGNQSVTVSARSRTDGRWVEKTVTWTNGTQVLPTVNWPESGVLASGLAVPEVPGYSLSWDEGRSWKGSTAVQEAPSTSARKVLSLQVKKDGAAFRYIYWLDARAPQKPSPEFWGGWNPKLVFSGDSEAVHRVTWTRTDGSSFDDSEQLWGPVGAWKVPDGVVAARVQVVGINSVKGSPATLGFEQTGWSTPQWEPWDQRGAQTERGSLPLGGSVSPRAGFWPVYEVSGSPDVQEPGPDSPLLIGAFLPSFPWGSDRTLYVRFAWRDAGGLVGPASTPEAVRVDRVPPGAPEVLAIDGQVLVKAAEGDEEGGTLGWAVTAERVLSPEALTFQPYQGALNAAALQTGSAKLWFHAQAQDRAGNSGVARLNVALAPAIQDSALVQVDSDPTVGETAVQPGGVYPWTAFRLRTLDSGKNLWVGVSDQSQTVPDDWAARVQPWTGIFSRSIARGDRRTFLVFWNAKTSDGWAWAQPKSLSLTLDLSAPPAPAAASWPSKPLGGPWTLELKPSRTGDVLRYSYTLDGKSPPDPLVSGEQWPGSRTWDASSGARVVVRVRVAAVSVSGLSVEKSLGEPVVIDRSPPSPVAPSLQPFTYSSGAAVVPLPSPGALVRYTLTSDGTFPAVPTEQSSLVPPTGLKLDGEAGRNLLYRFRWRSYSLAGTPGQATDAYGVLVDRTGSTASVPGDLGSAPVPRLSGVPDSGLSSTPVTLNSEGPTALLRYEVREGVGPARPVSPDSSAWTQPLILDGGPGVDRSYGVSLRSFSPDGRPLSDEVSYTIRVDRSFPSEPDLGLVADTRRPEAVLKTSTDPEETLFYRWTWDALGQSKGVSEWIPLGTEPPVFAAPGGAITQLLLEAYLKDEAGNIGPTAKQSLLIDQNAVYLAPDGDGDGSRGRPLGTVSGAIEKAHREGKTLILLASGSYRISRTLDLGGLQLMGGLDRAQWETTPEPGRSSWTAAAPFEGESLLEAEDRNWTLSSIDLATGTVPLTSVVSIRQATATVSNSTWNWSRATRGWVQEGGRAEWKNVSANYTAGVQGVFADWTLSEARVQGLRLSATQNQGGVLVSMKDSQAIFQDLVMVSKQAKGFDAVWSAVRSQITVDLARIQAGDGADRATAFLLKDTDAAFWNTDISLYAALANTGYQTTGGRLELQKTSLALLSGREFNQGLVLDGSQSILRSFDLKIELGAYQGGLTLDGGSLVFTAGKVRLAGGGQRVWGGQFLAEAMVNLSDVSWVLGTKTPGDLWKIEKPWAKGSAVSGSQTTGW